MLSDEINNIGWNLTDSETWKKSWFYCVMHFYCQFFTCITQVPSVAELVKSLFFTCFWLIFVYIVAVLSVGLFLSCPFLLTSLNKFILSLENALRSFACLTKGDVIAIKYNEKVSKKDDRRSHLFVSCHLQISFLFLEAHKAGKASSECFQFSWLAADRPQCSVD